MIVAAGNSHCPTWLATKCPSAMATREPTKPSTAIAVWKAAWRSPK